MKELTNLPIVKDRFNETDIDHIDLNPYLNDGVKLLLDGTDSVTTKTQFYSVVLDNLNKVNLSGISPIYIWVGIENDSLMTILSKRMETNNPNNYFYELVVRDYRGGLTINYGDTYDNVRDNAVSTRLGTIVCNLEDIAYIQVGSYIESKEILRHLTGFPFEHKEMDDKLTIFEEKLENQRFNNQLRSYFNTFIEFNNEFGSLYVDSNDTNYKGKWDLINRYDAMWKNYIDTINYIFPPNFADSVVIPSNLSDIYDSEGKTSDYERMFSIFELNIMLKVIGLDPIDINDVIGLDEGYYDYDGVLYQLDAPVEEPGLFSPDVVKNRIPLNGAINYKAFLYRDGKRSNEDIVFEDILYIDGARTSGLYLYDNKLYKESVLNVGLELYNGVLYENENISIGYKLYNNKLYNNGSLATGLTGYEGLLYKDGEFFNNITQVLLEPPTGNELYVYGEIVPDHLEPATIDELKTILTQNGTLKINTIVEIPDLKHVYTGRIESFSGLFNGYNSLRNIDFALNWNTSNISGGLTSLFRYCTKLENIEGLRYWDVSKIEFISSTFENNILLKDLTPLENWDTSSLTYLNAAFRRCESITSTKGLENFNTSNVTNMSDIFNGCKSLKDLTYIGNWDVSKISEFYQIFFNCDSLESLSGLENWKMDNCSALQQTFSSCDNLTDISAVNNWRFIKTNINMTGTFTYSNTNGGTIDLETIKDFDASKIQNLSSTFNNMGKVRNVASLKDWDISNANYVRQLFYDTQLEDITESHVLMDAWKLKAKNPADITYYNLFSRDEYQIIDGILYKDGIRTVGYVEYNDQLYNDGIAVYNETQLLVTEFGEPDKLYVQGKRVEPFVKITSISQYRTELANRGVTNTVTELPDLKDVYMGSFISAYYLFDGYRSLTSLNGIESWNLSNTTNLSYAFRNCVSLVDISALRYWDVSNVTNCYHIFSECNLINDITALENWDVGKCTNFDRFFFRCRSVTDISPISNWNFTSATTLSSFLYGCTGIQDFTPITNKLLGSSAKTCTLSAMFADCVQITDLTQFKNLNISNCKTLTNLFFGVPNLYNYLELSDWDFSNITSNGSIFRNVVIETVEELNELNELISIWRNVAPTSNTKVDYGNIVTTSVQLIENKIYRYGTLVQGYYVYNGKLYLNGSIAMGYHIYNTRYLYIDGNRDTADYRLYDNKLFIKGTLSRGYAIFEGKLYYDGILSVGYHVYEDKLYLDGILTTGTILYNEKLYIDGSLSVGYVLYENVLYLDGVISVDYHTYNGVLYYNGYPFNGVNTDIVYKNGLEISIQEKLFNSSFLIQLDKLVYKNNSNTGPLYRPTLPSFLSASYVGKAADIVWNNSFISFINEEDYLYINGVYTPCMLLDIETDKRLYLMDWELPIGLVKYDKIYYANGVATDSSLIEDKYFVIDNMLYFDGLVPEGFVTYEDILYYDGISLTGTYNGKFYVNGVIFTGVYENKLYFDGELAVGYHFYENVLYYNGEIPVGYIVYENKLYDNGVFYENKTQLIVDNQLLVNGLIVDNAKYPNDISELQAMLFEEGVINTITTLPDLKHIYTGNQEDFTSLFENYTSLTNVDGISSWNTSNVTTFFRMFYGTTTLDNVDGLLYWDTTKVSNMSRTFNRSGITNVNGLRNWNVKSVTNIGYIFEFCTSLTDISGLTNWNFETLLDARYFVRNCVNLSNIESLRNWNMSTVRYLSFAFVLCSKITDWTPLSNWNVEECYYFDSMFHQCGGLTNVDFCLNWTVSQARIMSRMFYNCINLQNLDGLQNFRPKFCTTLFEIFSTCSKLGNRENPLLGLMEWDVTSVGDFNSMIKNTNILISETNILLDEWKNKYNWIETTALIMLGLTSGYYLENGVLYYNGAVSVGLHLYNDVLYYNGLISMGLRAYDNKLYNDGYFYNNKIQILLDGTLYVNGEKINNPIIVNSKDELISEMTKLGINNINTTILPDMKHIYVGNITDIGYLFDYYEKLSNINGISSWNTGSVTNMERTFRHCELLEDFMPIYDWDTSNLENINGTFAFTLISNLQIFEIWDLGNLINAQATFYDCNNITDLSYLSNWDLRKVQDISRMFNDCTNITSVEPIYNWVLDSLTFVDDFVALVPNISYNMRNELLTRWRANTDNPYLDTIDANTLS